MIVGEVNENTHMHTHKTAAVVARMQWEEFHGSLCDNCDF